MARHFGPVEWTLARSRARTAEEQTRRFYAIPGREWERHPWDVAGLGPEDGPGAGLASVVRLQVALGRREPAARRAPELYRIRLHEDAILGATERNDGVTLGPLLLYVFAHELVHLVRFAVLGHDFEVDEHARRREERRVHELSRKVLEPLGDPGLHPVFQAYAAAAV